MKTSGIKETLLVYFCLDFMCNDKIISKVVSDYIFLILNLITESEKQNSDMFLDYKQFKGSEEELYLQFLPPFQKHGSAHGLFISQ